MAPTPYRHTWMWSVPTLVILFTFLWYKRKRGSSQSDPGGTARRNRRAISSVNKKREALSAKLVEGVAAEPLADQISVCEKSRASGEALPVKLIETPVEALGVQLENSEASLLNPSKEDSVKGVLAEKSEKFSSEPIEEICASDSSDSYETFKGKVCAENRLINVLEAPAYESEASLLNGVGEHCSERTVIAESREKSESSPSNSFEVIESDVSFIEEKRSAFEEESDGFAAGIIEEIVPDSTVNLSLAESEPALAKENSTDISVDHLVEHFYDPSTEFSFVQENSVDSTSETVIDNNLDESSPTDIKSTESEKRTVQSSESKVPLVNNSVDSLPEVENIEKVINTTELSVNTQLEDDSEISESSEVVNNSNSSGRASEKCSANIETGSEVLISDSYESKEAKKDSVDLVTNEVENSSGGSVAGDTDLSSFSPSDSETASETCIEVATKCCSADASAPTPSPAEDMQRPAEEEGAVAAATSAASDDTLAGKLAALDMGKGRDSANHSPAEVMLASPSVSSYSDEGSSDSGKGCSDVATPPSRTPASGSSVSGDVPLPSVYEFVLPQHLVGRLIGRHGAFVHQIKAKTNASILIKRHPETPKLKICAVEGTQLDIEGALEMIRKKFPLKHYPSVTLEQVCFVPAVPIYPVLPECLQFVTLSDGAPCYLWPYPFPTSQHTSVLPLVEGVSHDVILSSLVTPGHFFLQQPTHPTFPSLNRLNTCMNICYSEPNVPLLPTPIEPGVICAAPAMGGWFRAQVVSVDTENETYEVKFVDYGGYLSLEHSVLRQIRSDFMTLPFQASECFLANVLPVGGEDAMWSPEAIAVMEELTHGQVLQAQVCDYSEENIPNVLLYAVHCNQVVFVNHELVSRGLAEWLHLVEPEAEDASC